MKVGDDLKALFIVLNQVDYLEDILSKFLEIGVTGATILDSQGMGSAMVNNNKDVPLFGSLKTFLNNSRPFNKTIFTLIENDALLEEVVLATKSILGDIAKPGVGLMFTLPVDSVYGLRGTDGTYKDH